MAEGNRYFLQEFEPLTHLLKSVPHKSQKGLFSSDLEWTCLDATRDYIAIGTSIGTIYLYDRLKRSVEKLCIQSRHSLISCVKLKQSIDNLVAAGTNVGFLYIFQLPSTLPGGNQKLQMFRVQGLHASAVKCIEWSQNAMKVFSGDEDGVVVCTEIDYFENRSKSYFVCKDPNEIVQLDYAHKTLLVSTRHRSFLCATDQNNAVSQVGQKERKGLGPYGAVFAKSGAPSSLGVTLYAARPGLRLWKAGLDGTVQATYIFRELIRDTSQGLRLLPSTMAGRKDQKGDDCQFGPLHVLGEKCLVTYNGIGLFVMDPEAGSCLCYHTNLGHLLDVAVTDSEVFVLRSGPGRMLLRLATMPEQPPPEPVPIYPPAVMTSSTHSDVSSRRQSGSETSPVHVISETASRMSQSLVGALRGVSDKLHSARDGQQQQGGEAAPPWGRNSAGQPPGQAEGAGVAGGLERDASVDSAKEASPSGVLSPAEQLSPESESPRHDVIAASAGAASSGSLGEAVSGNRTRTADTIGTRTTTPGPYPPPVVCLEGDDITSIRVDRTSGAKDVQLPCSSDNRREAERRLSSGGGPTRGGDVTEDVVGQIEEEGIVYFTKTKKLKKKRSKLTKEPDTSSVASNESHDPERSNQASPTSSPLPGTSPPHASSGIGFASPRIATVGKETPRNEVSKGGGGGVDDGDKAQAVDFGINLQELREKAEERSRLVGTGNGGSGMDIALSAQDAVGSIYDRKGLASDVSDASLLSISDVVEASARRPATPPVPETLVAERESSPVTSMDLVAKARAAIAKPQGEKSATDAPVEEAATDAPAEDVGSEIVGKSVDGDLAASSNDLEDEFSRDNLCPSPVSEAEDFYSMYRSRSVESPESPTYRDLEDSIQDSVEYPASVPDASSDPDGRRAALTKIQIYGGLVEGDSLAVTPFANTWMEFSGPFYGIHSLCVSERHVWCVDSKYSHVYMASLASPGLKWRKLKDPAQQVAVSPSGGIVWRLLKNSVHVAKSVSARNPSGQQWIEVAKDVGYIAVDERSAWYVKLNGGLVIHKGISRERPSYRATQVATPEPVTQVAARRGVVWALTASRNILVRVGVESARQEGVDWVFMQGDGPCRLVSSLALSEDGTGWVLDLVGRVWFTPEVSVRKPSGSGSWYQVAMSEYLMQDASALDALRAAMDVTKLARHEEGGLISATPTGVWVVPRFENKIQVCRGSMLGHKWTAVVLSGMLSTTTWYHVCAVTLETGSGLVWTQQPNGSFFCFHADYKKSRVAEVTPPAMSVKSTSISATYEALWVLLEDGRVFIRDGMGSHCMAGIKWVQLGLLQLGERQLTHLCTGQDVVWAVDDAGGVYLRIGVQAPAARHLSPAWLPVDGCPSTAGAKFTHVFTGPNDWMVWAIDNKKAVYARKGISDSIRMGTHWVYVSGTPADWLSVSERLVYAVNPTGELFVRYGVAQDNIDGDYWKKIPGAFRKVSVSGSDELWAIDDQDLLYQRSLHFIPRRDPLKDAAKDVPQEGAPPAARGEEEGWEIL